MHVDGSGVEGKADQTEYFVASGAVFHENALPDTKNTSSHFMTIRLLGNLRGMRYACMTFLRARKVLPELRGRKQVMCCPAFML